MIKRQQAEELLKCYDSPMYFARNFITLYDFVKDERCTLQISKKHRSILNGLFRRSEDMFITGSRQTGVDTTVLVYLIYQIIFEGKNVYIKSRNMHTSKALMHEVLSHICRLPHDWNVVVNLKRYDRVEFSSGGSMDISNNIIGYRNKPDIIYLADAAAIKGLEDILIHLQFGADVGIRWIMANSGSLEEGTFKDLWYHYGGDVLRHTIHYRDVEHIDLERYLENKAHMPIRSWTEDYELCDIAADQ